MAVIPFVVFGIMCWMLSSKRPASRGVQVGLALGLLWAVRRNLRWRHDEYR